MNQNKCSDEHGAHIDHLKVHAILKTMSNYFLDYSSLKTYGNKLLLTQYLTDWNENLFHNFNTYTMSHNVLWSNQYV